MPQIAVLFYAYGKFISIRNSDKCSHNMTMSTKVIGLSHLEWEVIANVVRYNTRDFDYNKVQLEAQVHQKESAGMSHNAITVLVAKLTATLCLTSSMDRSHKGKLVGYRMAIRENELIIATGYSGDMALGAASFGQKADFFEGISGIRPMLGQKRRMWI